MDTSALFQQTFILVLVYRRHEEFNVDSIAECGQLNITHVARKKI